MRNYSQGFCQYKHGLTGHPLHRVWCGMRSRCYCKTHNQYADYGGRNIAMCNEWFNDFKEFYDWCILNKWKKGLHVDRVNNDKGYSPENCQIITNTENQAIGKKRKLSNNKSGFTGVVWHKGSKKWASIINVSRKRIFLGDFNTPLEALVARTAKEIELYGCQKTNLQYYL